jgi:hypothetical protein
MPCHPFFQLLWKTADMAASGIRTIKEYGMYIQEKADMEAKVEAMKADASYDEYDVRKQVIGRG